MIYINLLPVREIKKRIQAKQEISAMTIAFLGVLMILGLVAFIQSAKISGLETNITDLTNEKKQYTKVLAQIKTIEEGKKLLEKQIGIINQLNKNSALTVHILDEVANSTPSGRMWLTSLSQNGNNLQLAGMALDNRTIASYLDDLRESPYIQDVNLASASLQQYAGRNLKNFSITCIISVPEVKQ